MTEHQNNIIHILYDGESPGRFPTALMGFAVRILDPKKPIPADIMLLMVDVDLRDPDMISRLQAFRKVSQRGAEQIFAIGKNDLQDELQATALGARKTIIKPLTEKAVAQYILECRETLGIHGETAVKSVQGGADAIQNSLDRLQDGLPVDIDKIAEAGSNIATSIADLGIAEWLSTVRVYHQSTFQHILLVTGIACAFGQHTGMSKADIAKLTQAGLLHDIGKVWISDAILDKPGKLSDEEFTIIKRHPVDGFNKLMDQGNVSPDILHGVKHHHEYLDGSGYPDGLMAQDIPDLTRILTICDIMGALLEERSYKPPFSAEKSISILKGMGKEGKIELALVLALESMMKHQVPKAHVPSTPPQSQSA